MYENVRKRSISENFGSCWTSRSSPFQTFKYEKFIFLTLFNVIEAGIGPSLYKLPDNIGYLSHKILIKIENFKNFL